MASIFRAIKENILTKNKLSFVIILAAFLIFSILLYSRFIFVRAGQPWIKAVPSSLMKNGKPFRFVGANAVNLVFYDNWGLDVEKAVRTARENNISVLRLYVDWGWSQDEDFDRILNIASRYGMYVILTLTDCCCSSDYASLEKYFKVRAPFCNIKEKQSIDAFKKRIKKIIGRKNSINGKIYLNDPTILAWEVANELEYWHFDYHDVHNWISEMARYIKSLDKNHLVTIGISTDGPEFGKDSILYDMFNITELDFISLHYYPAVEILNSGEAVPESGYAHQIELRIKKFLSMRKPVIMGEFGFSNSPGLNYKTKTDPKTNNFYNEVIKQAMDSAFLAGASGAIFWGWGVPEEGDVPMWWRQESHSSADDKFCNFLKNYHIPKADE
jgi:endo-1,4-beta-mannosidase